MNWLGYAAPAWLAGLAALAVPLAIHLLSRGRQRRVAVGSTRWLAPAETLRARQIRPSRWWLLVLRCLLLTAVVLALAGPRLALPPRMEAASWLLVEPELVRQRPVLEPGNEAVYRAFDDALAAGAELHWLAGGEIETMAAAEPAAPPVAASADLWSLLRQVDGAAPAAAEFAIFTLGRQSALVGARPALGRAVEWHEVVDGRVNRWLERAVASDDGRLALIVGTSDRSGTRFAAIETEVATATTVPEPELAAERQADGWRLALAAGDSVVADDVLVVPAAAAPLEVALLAAGERRTDGAYVRAALEAAAAAAFRPLIVHDLAGDDDLPAADLLFWLAAEPVPQRWRDHLAGGGVLVSDALARFEACERWLWLGGAAPLRIARCGEVEAGAGGGATLWASADGRPLLRGERVGAGRWLRFASRFDPASNELVLSPRFPAWVLELVERAAPLPSARRAESDRRAAGGQGAPGRGATASGIVGGRELPITSGLWFLTLVAAGGERWMAMRSGG